MSEDRATTVNLPATAKKGFGRDAVWTVTVVGFEETDYGLYGYGPTFKEARANATVCAVELLRGVNIDPAFARDDDGSLIVVIPHGGDTRTYRINDKGWALIASGGPSTPEEFVSKVHHWTAIPPR